jgi:hypothetical protein
MWGKPQVTDLSVRYTEAGGITGNPDGVYYMAFGQILIGMSGPPIDDPDIKPIP